MNNDYSDIINLPHPTSKKHPHMPLLNRAAQFAPFAALTGHDQAIQRSMQESITQNTTSLTLSDIDDIDYVENQLNE